MKYTKKIFVLCLALMMVLSCVPFAFAAASADATIDENAECSLTIYKYDWTNAVKDGVWDEDSFISTGWRESYVEEVLGGTVREGDPNDETDNALGNGQNSNGYALKGVEFTSLRVADIITFSESKNDAHPQYSKIQVLYAFNKQKTAELLSAIGLTDGAGRYQNAGFYNDQRNEADACWYYQSDVIINALATALANNATNVKNALENYVKKNNGVVMNKTDENGRTTLKGQAVGLYLVVETAVPEMVTSTTNPFFVSLPMTTVSGNENSASPIGGSAWNYNVVIYPKNETGIPTLEKTVREDAKDTGIGNDSDNINDAFAHTATGSAGDTMEYQIISTLPTITSQATGLSVYNIYDTIAEGLTYNRDVKIEFFVDKACSHKVTTWTPNDGRFTVTYSADNHTMTIDMTPKGLAEINGAAKNINGDLYTGYSNYTARVTYSAEMNSDTTFAYGDAGNCNKVVLTWKRTSGDYYDTLIDDCHVYSFGMNLTKQFSDMQAEDATSAGLYHQVKFVIYNETDAYWVTAKLNQEEGIYYVTGHVDTEEEATQFTPVTSGDDYGKVVVRGLENDTYRISEVETANGYTLLQKNIQMEIVVDDYVRWDIYEEDAIGVTQNAPRYAFSGEIDLSLANIPQKQLAHYTLRASAKIDNCDVSMAADGESENAEALLTVVNTRGFDLPQTGDRGMWMYGVIGVVLMTAAILIVVVTMKKKKPAQR